MKKLDLKSLENLINYQIESEVNGLLSCGTTGEALLLSKDEQETLIKHTLAIMSRQGPFDGRGKRFYSASRHRKGEGR